MEKRNMNNLEIIYSPVFDGHVYVGKENGILMNKEAVGSSKLLEELELRMGVSYGNVDNEARVYEYYDVLSKVIGEDHMLRRSFDNDVPKKDDDEKDKKDEKDKGKYIVTTALLGWRDSLIMAGWDREKGLPGDKLSVISEAEKLVKDDGVIRMGEADRWLDLSGKEKCENVSVTVQCDKKLIPAVIKKVLESQGVCLPKKTDNITGITKDNVQMLEFHDVTDAYEWLAEKDVERGQVVVCRDEHRLDSVLRANHKPTAVKMQVNAHHVVKDVRDVLVVPDSLIWLDCNGEYGYDYKYGFLSKAERESLAGMGIAVPSEDEMLAAIQNDTYRILNAIQGDVIIVKSDYDCGTLLAEHPLVTILRQMGVSTNTVTITKTGTLKDEIKLKAEAELTGVGNCDRQDVVMSKSSLDTLIQLPFNFVLEREAHLYEPDDSNDLNTEMGLVAHKVVELMVKDYKEKGKALSTDDFDDYVDRALDAEDRHRNKIGGDLLKPENALGLEGFKTSLKPSIEALIEIINQNELEVVASEMQIPAVKDGEENKGVVLNGIGGKWTGNLDLVLKTKEGKYVIFDFKYSTSEKHKKALEENTSTQFEVYKHLFDEHSKLGEASACAYYLFPLATMYITEDDFEAIQMKDNDHVEVVKVDEEKKHVDLWNMIAKTYDFRMKQLKDGTIEQGEGMDMATLGYNQHEGLYPLAPVYGKDDKKGGPYRANHIVLKNQLR